MKRPVALVTGIAGFAGSFLAEELLEQGYDVRGADIKGGSLTNIEHLLGRIQMSELDLLDEDNCAKLVQKINPDYIFHLGAVASVGRSFDMERMTCRVNVEGTLNLLQPAMHVKGLKKFLFVSSADIYGIFSPKTKLLTEKQLVNPISPYGISKAAAEAMCGYYFRNNKLPVVLIRSFNHAGPRQREDFVVASFARQVAAIEADRQKPVISVGDLSAKRDLSDVRDIVRGYRLLAEKGKAGEIYQLSSGKAVTIQSVLHCLVKLSDRKITVQVDKARLRKSDIPMLRGSNRKAVQAVGYRARYSLEQTLSDTLTYWRNRFSVGSIA
jgi:GDP-4-dehydro-6-deoxy-D-mannose reductase